MSKNDPIYKNQRRLYCTTGLYVNALLINHGREQTSAQAPYLIQLITDKENRMSETVKPIARGRVTSLAINGDEESEIYFDLAGPRDDRHYGLERRLCGHDGDYIKTSGLTKGSRVFNWRTWTGLSEKELNDISQTLGRPIPIGCLLENITFSDIPNFSHLVTGTRLVFPMRQTGDVKTQAILAVWERNGPCKTVGDRLAGHHSQPDLSARFVRAAKDKRGVMGFVISAGPVYLNDGVLVYPPLR